MNEPGNPEPLLINQPKPVHLANTTPLRALPVLHIQGLQTLKAWDVSDTLERHGRCRPLRPTQVRVFDHGRKGRVYKLAWVRQKDGTMVGESLSRRMEKTRTKEERFQKEKQLL